MVAYSFKKQFVTPIRVGLKIVTLKDLPAKLQTIRAVGKRRHAMPGDTLQLYCGMRTRDCFKIGDARCTGLKPIQLVFDDQPSVWIDGMSIHRPSDLNVFAEGDGFKDWEEMVKFWAAEHPDAKQFNGMLITWEPLT